MENKTTVILADANEEFRAMLQQTIEKTGEFDVVGTVGDGLSALQLVSEKQPQLLVTDILLPVLDGFGLLDRIEALPNRPKTIHIKINKLSDTKYKYLSAVNFGFTNL